MTHRPIDSPTHRPINPSTHRPNDVWLGLIVVRSSRVAAESATYPAAYTIYKHIINIYRDICNILRRVVKSTVGATYNRKLISAFFGTFIEEKKTPALCYIWEI